MDIEELSKKIDKYHDDDVKKAKKEIFEDLSFLSLGWGLAIIGFAVKELDIIDTIFFAAAALFFIFFGIRAYKKSKEL